MSLLSEANKLMRDGRLEDALRKYGEVETRSPKLKALVGANIEIVRHRIDLKKKRESSLGGVEVPGTGHPSPVVSTHGALSPASITVTLTSIKSRLHSLIKVVDSLHRQELAPKGIEIYLSETPYLIDEGVDRCNPLVLELERFSLVNVIWVENIGPYRKILPFLERHFNTPAGEERVFVTVDDDTIYPDHFLSSLYDNFLAHDCVVAFRGRHINISGDGIPSYSEWEWGKSGPALANVPTGKDGVLYSTKFFTRDFLDMAVARNLAPTSDDLWIRWHCAMNGVPAIILNPEACTSDYKSFPVVDYSKEYRSNSLYSMHNSPGSQGKNDISVVALEDYFMRRYGYNLRSVIVGDYSGKEFPG